MSDGKFESLGFVIAPFKVSMGKKSKIGVTLRHQRIPTSARLVRRSRRVLLMVVSLAGIRIMMMVLINGQFMIRS